MTRKKTIKTLVFLALIAAAGVGARRTILGPPWVELVRPQPRELVAEVYGNGTVDAKVTVNIASKIGGRLQEVLVEQGAVVERGQLLARLDDRELREQLRQAVAGTDKAAAAVGLESANLEKARANLGLAEKNVQRYRLLAAQELVARQEVEQYENVFQVASAESIRASASLATAKKEEAVSGAARESSRVRLADTLICAPFKGIVTRRDLEPGATVNPGVPILVVVDPQTVWVKANVDESLLKGISEGMAATITLRSGAGERIPGQVARLAWESDRVTEELEVDVAFTNPRPVFHLGEQAEVLITAGAKTASVTLPATVIQRLGKKCGVWTLAAGRLRYREVALGLHDRRGWVEVVSGLEPGAEVVAAAPEKMQQFKEGQQVRVRR